MRKLKIIFSILLIIPMILCDVLAYADALKVNPRHSKAKVSLKTSDTIALFDFYDSEMGLSPEGFTKHNNLTTKVYDVGNAVKKNCLELEDTTLDESYSGPMTTTYFPENSGVVSFEMRYMFIPTSGQPYASAVFGFDTNGVRISRFTIASQGGIAVFNDSQYLDPQYMVSGSWYRLKVVFDFDNQVLDCAYTNEATGVTRSAKDIPWYTSGRYKSLDSLTIQGSSYGGKWVVDYIHLKKNAKRLADEIVVEKGKPQVNVPSPVSHSVKGRTNITLDGKYKYTTVAPRDTGKNVFVTLKNLALIMDLKYYKDGNVFVVASGDNELVFTDNSFEAKGTGANMTLSEKSYVDDGQLMVPVKDVSEYFGYGYSFDSTTNTVKLTTAKEVISNE